MPIVANDIGDNSDEFLSSLIEIVKLECQHTFNEKTYLDSRSLPTYARALKLLAKHNKIKITGSAGQRVLAEWI